MANRFRGVSTHKHGDSVLPIMLIVGVLLIMEGFSRFWKPNILVDVISVNSG